MLKIFFIFLLIFYAYSGSAQERHFAYTYESVLLPKDVRDVEVWNTFKFGRAYYYSAIQQRTEIEIGISKKLQTAFYLNIEEASYGDPNFLSDDIYHEPVHVSFSNEWIYQLADRYIHSWGAAVYGEITAGTQQESIEGKFIIDKFQKKNIYNFNLTTEYKINFTAEKGRTRVEHIFPVDLNFAYMHMFGKVGAGFELNNRNNLNNWSYSALYGGPCVSYSGYSYRIIVTILPQIADLKNKNFFQHRELQDQQKFELRILFPFQLESYE